MIKLTQVNIVTKYSTERHWYDDDGQVEGDEINHEQRKGSDGWQEQLVAPPEVKHIVSEAEENHTANGEQRSQELDVLSG